MASILDREPGRRWPRSQRFALSARGIDAERSYRSMIVASRAEAGRSSFDAARDAWAAPLGLQPGDGVFLGELQQAARTIDEITASLESCGVDKREIKRAIDRLVTAGLVEVQAPPPPAAPPAPSWR